MNDNSNTSSEKISPLCLLCAFSVMLASVLLYWHWEAMLISYLATRVIVLPFKNIEELVKTTSFKIALNPGTSYEDAFKYSTEPSWQEAYKYRIEPYLDDYHGHAANMIKFPKGDSSIALYDNFFSARYKYLFWSTFKCLSLCGFTNFLKKKITC